MNIIPLFTIPTTYLFTIPTTLYSLKNCVLFVFFVLESNTKLNMLNSIVYKDKAKKMKRWSHILIISVQNYSMFNVFSAGRVRI